jgi:hypothetical protein
LYIKCYKNQPDDFNIHHLCRWHYGDMIVTLAEKDRCPLYKTWQHLIQTHFHELVDLTMSEPRHDQGLLNISSPPIIDLVTPEPALVVDLSTPEPDQLVASVINLSTSERDQLVAPVVDLSIPEPDQLMAALSVSAQALAVSQDRPPELQLLTPELHRYLLS